MAVFSTLRSNAFTENLPSPAQAGHCDARRFPALGISGSWSIVREMPIISFGGAAGWMTSGFVCFRDPTGAHPCRVVAFLDWHGVRQTISKRKRRFQCPTAAETGVTKTRQTSPSVCTIPPAIRCMASSTSNWGRVTLEECWWSCGRFGRLQESHLSVDADRGDPSPLAVMDLQCASLDITIQHF